MNQEPEEIREFHELPNQTKRSAQLYARLQLLIILGLLAMALYKYFME